MERILIRSQDLLQGIPAEVSDNQIGVGYTAVVLSADAQATIAALQEKLTAALKVKADYDRWLSGGVYFTTAEYEKHAEEHRQREAALQARVNGLEKEIATRDSTDSILATRIRELEARLTQRTAECDALKLVNDTHMKTVMKLSHIVEQQTAELEAVKADTKNMLDVATRRLHEQVNDLQAEMERVSLLSSHNERRFEEVDKKYKELRTLILTLPKVEGEIVAQAGYVKDRKKVYACFGSDADMTAYAALLTHRQGMEG